MSWEIRQGDALGRLRDMPADSVQCCITSPPYFGLRDYSEAGQIGLESTPDEYVSRLVEVFREVRRVLRDDGTVWLNVGDSYNADGRKGRAHMGEGKNSGYSAWVNKTAAGTKPKDLLMIPAQVALALRADGWWLRSEIIWAKKNCMPESVTDRPTSAHEKLFLLAKSGSSTYWTHPERPGVRSLPVPDYEWRHPETGERSRTPQPKPWRRVNLWQGHDYFYDADAIREGQADSTIADPRTGTQRKRSFDLASARYGDGTSASRRSAANALASSDGMRNKRNVWTIATQPYADAHFATFPPKLVEPCVLAGSSPKACGECGAPWVRQVERTEIAAHDRLRNVGGRTDGYTIGTGKGPGFLTAYRTLGWQPSCAHDDNTGRSVVLDPFAGSGTTGLVALRHDRGFIGLELNADYCELARRRIIDDAPLLNSAIETTSL